MTLKPEALGTKTRALTPIQKLLADQIEVLIDEELHHQKLSWAGNRVTLRRDSADLAPFSAQNFETLEIALSEVKRRYEADGWEKVEWRHGGGQRDDTPREEVEVSLYAVHPIDGDRFTEKFGKD